jgi:hypothetical protein
VLSPRGKAVELAETELVVLLQRVEHRRADDEGASPPPADGSGAASLPKALDKEPIEVIGLLRQEGAHLRLMYVRRERPIDSTHSSCFERGR